LPVFSESKVVSGRAVAAAYAMAIGGLVALANVSHAQPTASRAGCTSPGLAVQVLGSGGPFPNAARASASYLLWRDGRAIVMVDAGGGSLLRFGEAQAQLQDLALLGITHLHPDHVGELPAFLWLTEQTRHTPLPIAGPSGGSVFPAFDVFLTRLFDAQKGAFPILSGTLGGEGQGVRLDVHTIDATVGTMSSVLTTGDVDVRAIGIPHGNVPALAYRVHTGGRTVVFSTDQTGSDSSFVRFAADADVLVMHLALSPTATGRPTQMHASPTVVGEVAQRAKAKRLVLSHIIEAPAVVAARDAYSGSQLQQAVADVAKAYTGPVEVAKDLLCIPVR
jgi:ribonuclease BN (tRNA processing enzyme)